MDHWTPVSNRASNPSSLFFYLQGGLFFSLIKGLEPAAWESLGHVHVHVDVARSTNNIGIFWATNRTIREPAPADDQGFAAALLLQPARSARPDTESTSRASCQPPEESSATGPAGMTSYPSGSSEDGDTSPVEAPHVNSSSFKAAREHKSSAQAQSATNFDRRPSPDQRPSFSINRRSSSVNWRPSEARNGTIEKSASPARPSLSSPLGFIPTANGVQAKDMEKAPEVRFVARRSPWRSAWAISLLSVVVSIVGIGFLLAVLHSSVTRQIDPKGCRMSYMRPSYAKLKDFDTEHTRLASKYSLYLYREQGIDRDTRVGSHPK